MCFIKGRVIKVTRTLNSINNCFCYHNCFEEAISKLLKNLSPNSMAKAFKQMHCYSLVSKQQYRHTFCQINLELISKHPP